MGGKDGAEELKFIELAKLVGAILVSMESQLQERVPRARENGDALKLGIDCFYFCY